MKTGRDPVQKRFKLIFCRNNYWCKYYKILFHEYLHLVILSKENPLFKDFCKCAKTCKNHLKKNLAHIQKEQYQISFKKYLKAGGSYFFKLKKVLGMFFSVDPIITLTAIYTCRSKKLF